MATSTMLITVSGDDRPGVTASLLEALAPFGFPVLDIEQVVIRGHLSLGLLLATDDADDEVVEAARQAACEQATTLDLKCDIRIGLDGDDARRSGRLVVTAIGSPLCAGGLHAITAAITDLGANIDRIIRVARRPVTALEFEVSGADRDELRRRLALVSADAGVDLSVDVPGVSRRGARLVVLDVDSTLIQDEVIELIAEHAGCTDAVAEVTNRAMTGELDFAESLAERVKLLAGVNVSSLEDVRRAVRLTPGARTLVTTLRHLGYHVALVSGGFHEVVDELAAELGVEQVRANRLEVADGTLTGRTTGPVIDRKAKAAALVEIAAEYGIPLERTVAIGDGANDLDMIATAGLGIAFNAKPVLRQSADTAVNVPYLDTVLFLLGITGEEADAAMAKATAQN